jgi:membrane-associated phospholipid phosphatase
MDDKSRIAGNETEVSPKDDDSTTTNRRNFIRGAGALGAVTLVPIVGSGTANAALISLASGESVDPDALINPSLPAFPETSTAAVTAAEQVPAGSFSASALRRNRAANLRISLAVRNRIETPANLAHPNNGDEARYADRRGSYTKGLPHNADGTVVASAYSTLQRALNSGERNPGLFDSIALSDPSTLPFGGRLLTSPQSGLAFEVEGRDAHSYVIPPAPAFASREEAAEIAENYWMALLRDVPFSQYPGNSVAIAAARDLTSFGADFKGAKDSTGVVTPRLLFRGVTPGVKLGPWYSQFWYQPANVPLGFGSNDISQRTQTLLPLGRGGKDYMTRFADWLLVQRGGNPLSANRIDPRSGAEIGTIDPALRYMRSGRDIAQWVHNDVLFQGYFQAFLVLAGLGAPLNPGNPYIGNRTQAGFSTFGPPAIATILCEVSTRALHAVWYQKWQVHRRLRPETFAGRIEFNRTNPGRFDVSSAIKSSTVLPAVFAHNERINGVGQGTYLLPMAFPEGSPTHPAYGAGHATVAGACVTVLKAMFDGTTPISRLAQPLDATLDGLNVVTYTGADAGLLTVNGELEKIAYNVANGRNVAGVHWRSDSFASLALGEQVALSVLREQRPTYNEFFSGFTLTRFDGTKITV